MSASSPKFYQDQAPQEFLLNSEFSAWNSPCPAPPGHVHLSGSGLSSRGEEGDVGLSCSLLKTQLLGECLASTKQVLNLSNC